MNLLLLTAGLARAATPGEIDVGPYVGAFLPSSQHELYDPTAATHRALSPVPQLGGRFAYQLLPFLGPELELDVGAGGAGGPVFFHSGAVLLGAHLPDLDSPDAWDPSILVGGGWLAVGSSPETSLGGDLDWTFAWGASLSRRLGTQWKARVDLRHDVTAKYTVVKQPAHHVEVLLGLQRVVRMNDADADQDGIFGAADACPMKAEVVNGYKDDDGCPDALATVHLIVRGDAEQPLPDVEVRQGDTVLGKTDAYGELVLTDRTPGTPLGTLTYVPDPASGLEGRTVEEAQPLREGDQDRGVALQYLPGAVRIVARSERGAIGDASVSFRGNKQRPDEPLGADGDYVFVLPPGSWTLLVSAPSFGIESRTLEILPDQRSLVVIEVKLEPAVVQTTKDEVVILEAVQFDTAKATIRKESEPLLREVANNLLRYTEIRKIEVQGHTDSQGSDAFNQTLSQQRTESVVQALVSYGVTPERLTGVGYGETCAMSTNDTDVGRAENRRVQFMVIDPAPSSGIPCHGGTPARKAAPTTVTRPAE
jgi:outer membrane protein OmpA-like peptidoglycan-associated protein